VSEKIPWFNAVNCAAVLFQYGFTLTSETKEALATELVPLERLSFLKRRFVALPQTKFVLCPLELDMIKDLVMWVRKDLALKDATRTNCEVAIEELVHHGPEIYREIGSKIVEACRGRDIQLSLPEWDAKIECWIAKCSGYDRLKVYPVKTTGIAGRFYLESRSCDAPRRNISLASFRPSLVQ
jgi:hypothetical protein